MISSIAIWFASFLAATSYITTMFDGCKTHGEIDKNKIIQRMNQFLFGIVLILLHTYLKV